MVKWRVKAPSLFAVTYLILAQTSVNALLPSGKLPTTRDAGLPVRQPRQRWRLDALRSRQPPALSFLDSSPRRPSRPGEAGFNAHGCGAAGRPRWLAAPFRAYRAVHEVHHAPLVLALPGKHRSLLPESPRTGRRPAEAHALFQNRARPCS